MYNKHKNITFVDILRYLHHQICHVHYIIFFFFIDYMHVPWNLDERMVFRFFKRNFPINNANKLRCSWERKKKTLKKQKNIYEIVFKQQNVTSMCFCIMHIVISHADVVKCNRKLFIWNFLFLVARHYKVYVISMFVE